MKTFTISTNLQITLALVILLIILSACGGTPATVSEATESIDEVASTPIPAGDTASQEIASELSQEVANDDGLIFRIEQAEMLEAIEGGEETYQPENDVFLVLKGTLINSTAEFNCALIQHFELQAGDSRYKMSRELLSAAQETNKLNYPGAFLGQCMDSGKQEASFLVFDVPQEVTNLKLFFQKGEIALGSMANLTESTNDAAMTTDTADGVDSDDIINEQIVALECEEAAFMKRLEDTSGYIDLDRSSFPAKTVVFKDNYVETEYFAYKKSLEMSARFLRDFPCLETLTVIVFLDGQKYTTQVEKDKYEEFLGVDFESLQADIETWRAFLGTIDKPLVETFAKEYIIQTAVSDFEGPTVTAIETNINIRSGPGTDYDVVSTLPVGESLSVIGRNVDSSWWQVSTPNGNGWVAAFVVTANDIDDSILVVEAPSLSSQTEANQLDNSAANSEAASSTAATSVPTTTIAEPPQPESECHSNARITAPAWGASFSSRVVGISGYANVPNFHHYKIEYSTDPDGGGWNYLFEKDTPVENGILMQLETSTVPYGPYGIRLTVLDMSGNYPESCIRWFNDPRYETPEPINSEYYMEPTPDMSGNAPCLCDGDYYNCPDFLSSGSAQQCFDYCKDIGRGDVHDLDRDGDRSVCEWLD